MSIPGTPGTSGTKPSPLQSDPTQTSRPLRTARAMTTVPTNWVESHAPRTRGNGVSGVTPREVTAEAANPPRAGSVEAQLRQKVQEVVLAADQRLDDVMVALSDGNFTAVPTACKAVATALAPIVDRSARKAEEDSRKAEEAMRKDVEATARKAADSSKKAPDIAEKAVKAARKLASFRQELGIDAKTPGIAEFTADACGDRLDRLLPKLKDAQLAALNGNLEQFLALAKAEQKGGSQTSAPEYLVPRQLLFSVKAELLDRMLKMHKDSSDAGVISKFSKDELVELRDLTGSLDRMVRSGTPADAALPGTRLTWARIQSIDQLAESRLGSMLKIEGAIRRVEGAEKRLKGSDLAQLKRLKGAADFLASSGVTLTDISLGKLQKDASARIKEVEQARTDALITPDMRKGPSNKFSAKDVPDAKLFKLMHALLQEDDLTQELEDVKKDVETAINDRKQEAGTQFLKAFRAVLTVKKSEQTLQALLNSAVVAQASLTSFQAVNWDLSEEGLADWIGQEVRAPTARGQRVEPDPVYVQSMTALRDNLAGGEAKVVRDLLAASKVAGSTSAVDYFDLLHHTLSMLLDGSSAPLTSRAVRATDLTSSGLEALQTTLNLTVKGGRLVEFKPAAQPMAQSPQTPRPQKN